MWQKVAKFKGAEYFRKTLYFTKNECDGVLYQMTWPPQSPDLNHIYMVWDESDDRKAASKCSAYVGTSSKLLENNSR